MSEARLRSVSPALLHSVRGVSILRLVRSVCVVLCDKVQYSCWFVCWLFSNHSCPELCVFHFVALVTALGLLPLLVGRLLANLQRRRLFSLIFFLSWHASPAKACPKASSWFSTKSGEAGCCSTDRLERHKARERLQHPRGTV